MLSFNSISPDKLSRLIGRPDCPVLIDVQTDEDFGADPRLITGRRPASLRHRIRVAAALAGYSAVVICQKGLKPARAWLLG